MADSKMYPNNCTDYQAPFSIAPPATGWVTEKVKQDGKEYWVTGNWETIGSLPITLEERENHREWQKTASEKVMKRKAFCNQYPLLDDKIEVDSETSTRFDCKNLKAYVEKKWKEIEKERKNNPDKIRGDKYFDIKGYTQPIYTGNASWGVDSTTHT